MNLEEKERMLAELEGGREALRRAVDGLSEDGAARVPEAGKWSVLECVEHLVVAEEYLYWQIVSATGADGPMRNDAREAQIVARAADRTRVVPAPDVALPAGRFSKLAEAMGRFEESRARTIQYVENCAEDLRARITTHPIIGKVNSYETLLILAAHPHRHAKQIDEIRTTNASQPGLPSV